MNITINEESVDFTLADEKSALDVFSGIETWLKEQSLFISDLGINGEQVFVDDIKIWGETPVDEIESFDFYVLSKEELSAKHFHTVISFFSLFAEKLKSGDKTAISEMLTEFKAVTDSFPALLGVKTGDQMKEYITSSVKESGLPEELSPEKTQKLIIDFTAVISIFEGRIREICQPKEELNTTREALISLLPETEELSVNLQTGNEVEAMNFIIKVVELLQKVIRLIFLIEKADKEDDGVLSGFAGRITEILTQIEEAFVSEDSVLIGDLMEYELKPVLEEFPLIKTGG